MPVVINGYPNRKDMLKYEWTYGTPFPRIEDTPTPGTTINGANVEYKVG